VIATPSDARVHARNLAIIQNDAAIRISTDGQCLPFQRPR